MQCLLMSTRARRRASESVEGLVFSICLYHCNSCHRRGVYASCPGDRSVLSMLSYDIMYYGYAHAND